MKLFFYLSFCFIFKFASTSLSPVAPIVWMKTDISVHSSVLRDSIQIPIPDICSSLRQMKDSAKDAWCSGELEENLVKPLEKLCTPSYAQNPISQLWRRSKRSAAAQREESAQEQRDKDKISRDEFIEVQSNVDYSKRRIQDLILRHQTLEEKVINLSDDHDRVKFNVTNLNKKIDRMVTRLDQIDQKITLQIELIPLVVLARIYFIETKSNFIQINKQWNQKQRNSALNSKLMDIMVADAKKREEFEDVIINSCYVDNGIVNFDVNRTIEISPKEIQILKANPFTLYQSLGNPNSNMAVKLEYNGPKYAIYNASSQCVIPSADPKRSLPIVPSNSECPRQNTNAPRQYWRMSCESMYFYGSDLIQIKPVDDHYFIYCFGHSITVFKKTIPCPDYAFSLHQNETFQIGDGKEGDIAGFEKILMTSTLSGAAEAISAKITNQLMPGLLRTLSDNSALTIQCSRSGGSNFSWTPSQNLELVKGSGNHEEGKTDGDGHIDQHSSLPLVLAIAALVVGITALALGIYAICSQKKSEERRRKVPSQFPMLQ